MFSIMTYQTNLKVMFTGLVEPLVLGARESPMPSVMIPKLVISLEYNNSSARRFQLMTNTNSIIPVPFRSPDKSQAKSRMVRAVEGQEITTGTSLGRAQKEAGINRIKEIQIKEIPIKEILIEVSHAEETTNPDKIANEIMFALKYDRSNPPDGHLPSQQPALMHNR